MLNKQAAAVLKRIVDETDGEEGSVVIDKSELIEASGGDMTEGALGSLIEEFDVAELVSLKYGDKESFCLSVLPKGRVAVAESDKKYKSIGNVKVDINYKRVGAIAFLGSLIGAAVGGGLVVVIAWLIITFAL